MNIYHGQHKCLAWISALEQNRITEKGYLTERWK